MDKIILASDSPRRKQLLSNLGLPQFEVVSPRCKESMEGDDPVAIVMGLAFQKAYDVAKKYPGQIVIGADTIVYKDRILGKPIDEEEARLMLKSLSGHWHSVYTGIAVMQLDTGIKCIDAVETKVKMMHLSNESINRYVASKEPLDKAGAYGIQGLGSVLIEGIQGDYFNVVGLPLHRLVKLLKAYFNINLL